MKLFSQMFVLMVLFSVLFTAQAHAQSVDILRGTVGNGGDVLVCKFNNTYTYQILDSYEGKDFYKLTYDFPQENSWKGIVEHILVNRLQKYSPIRAKRYMMWLDTFMNSEEIDFVTGKTLNDVPDSNHISTPNNCVLKQIAIQRSDKELSWGGKRYTIDLDLWVKLDEKQKAVLVLHEIILREAILAKQENSIPTRYLNSYLFSKIHLEASSDAVYKELERVFPGSLASEIKSLPFGTDLVTEKVLFVMDKSGSNTTTDLSKLKRKTAFLNLHTYYFNVNYSQSLITFNDYAFKYSWDTDKFSFYDNYILNLQTSDEGGSNVSGAVKVLEQEVLALDSTKFERLNIVFMLDGEANVGESDLQRIFENLIEYSKNSAVKIHFVNYGNYDIVGLKEVAKKLESKIYKSDDLGNIKF